MSDNTTAIAYINNMGGIKSSTCNEIAKETWSCCEKHSIWLSAAFIPGKENKAADKKSREFNDATEWQLSTNVFYEICQNFGFPDIDLFASRNNKQIDKYVSWKPEPEAYAVDAFSICWSNDFMYIFPPFSIVGKVIRKIIEEKVRAIVIIPQWPTQYWYPMAIKAAKEVMDLKTSQNLLQLKHDKEKVHPLFPKLKLRALLI